MLPNIDEIIKVFETWYDSHIQSSFADSYSELRSREFLLNLEKGAFIDYFYSFVKEGGKIQSGGHRTANKFKEIIEQKYTQFRSFILKVYDPNFNLDEWLNGVSDFNHFGWGDSTIFLNRVNPNKFAIVNNKSQEALKILGYEIKGDFVRIYHAIEAAQLKLMSLYPSLQNFFKSDALSQFLLGEEGQKFLYQPIINLIQSYKFFKKANSHSAEFYKYEAINHFQENWDIDSPNFAAMAKESLKKHVNLAYPLAVGVINTTAEKEPEKIRECFRKLYNEQENLNERIATFKKNIDSIMNEIKPGSKGFQDERAISVYLTFRYPDKYTFYKDSYYSKMCEFAKFRKKRAGKKYEHYLSIINEFREKWVMTDQELWGLTNATLPKNAWKDEKCLILAQDVLYVVFDQNETTNYWIFQCNPNMYDFETALRNEMLTDWTITAYKDKIGIGDQVIIWKTGNEAGCYALAEVNSQPHNKTSSSNDHLWKKEDKNALKVDIKITHNLVDNPILKKNIEEIEELNNLKVGYQGTNFSATKEEFQAILDLIMSAKEQKYWLYAPGENASKWDEFYNKGIMGLGWDKIGDIKQYKTRTQIRKALINAYGGEGSKKNDVTANDDFLNKISVGDVVIAKKGRSELLGYGIVASDYEYDNNRLEYQKIRRVDWKLKGNWKINFSLIVKTLTDITQYTSDNPNYDTFHELLMGIMANELKLDQEQINHPLNTIFYGPPGTGKTYNTVLRAAEIVENRTIRYYDEALEIFKANLHNQIEFITFHQNYSYEDFIQGLRPDTEDDKKLTFERKDGVFKIIADRALANILEAKDEKTTKINFDEAYQNVFQKLVEGEINEFEIKMKESSFFITNISEKSIEFRKQNGESNHTLSLRTLAKMYDKSYNDIISGGLQPYYNPLLELLLEQGEKKHEKVEKKNYVIIIDEINRANISRVFGELITLIEPDKRSHGTIPMEAKLPSGETFVVPSNLYIIGTMNTADKSIALLDIALRRRFEFEAMYPKYSEVGLKINDEAVLKSLNQSIIDEKGYDFQIGHSFFMDSKDDPYDFEKRMNVKVIPLLLEYFMNDDKVVRQIINRALQGSDFQIKEKSWPIIIERISAND